MYDYVTPSISAFQNRKLFHSHQKEQYETVEQWFHCIIDSLEGCEYGKLSEFMLIDKFITALDDESYEKYAPYATLTIDAVRSIGFDNKNLCKSPSKATHEQITLNVDDFLAVNDIKVEEDDAISSNVSEDCLHVQDQNHEALTVEFDPCSQEIQKPIKSSIFVHQILADEIKSKLEIKGFRREKNRGIICLDCGKCFKQKNTYNYHKRRHTGKNLYYCHMCEKVFVKAIQLQRHSLTHDNDNKSFECYLCSSKFDRIHGLRIHFTILHTTKTMRNLPCPKCSKAFSKQRDLDLHMKIHQGLVDGHKCKHCDKIYDKISALKEHLIVHLNTKEFVCETCGKTFKTKHLLKRHMQYHNEERKFKCCECGQVLKSSQTLKNHMRQHTGERPYRCDLCEKTFVTQPSLLKHLRVHRQEKPHGCTVCIKRFATNYHLKVHMNTHTGAKPYECKVCDRAFTQLGTLKAHHVKIHSPIGSE